jgi:hypothetical protein
MKFQFKGVKMLRCVAAIGLVALLIISMGYAQDSLELEIIVEDVTAFPGEQNVTVPIYMKNYTDTVIGFQVWLMFDRPDIAEFQMAFDSSGSLTSGWETVIVNSLGGFNHDILITATANDIPPYTNGIAPQHGELPLIKGIADVYDIPDTMTERTASIHVIVQPPDHFCFTNQDFNCIGIIEGELDTTKVTVTGGSLTVLVPICGDIDGSDGNPNVADLTYFVEYLFFEGPLPPVMNMANVDGEGGINVADLTYLVEFLFFEGASPDCP